MVHVKGSAFASRLKWIQLNHGQEGVERLTQVVSSQLSEIIQDGIQMRQWYAFELFIEFVKAIDNTFGQGDLALIKELARHGADANLTTIYRLFFKVGTVKWILERAARLWNVHYDSGTMKVRHRRGLKFSKSVDLIIKDFETPDCIHCTSVSGWAERSVELSGGEEVKCETSACRKSGGKNCTLRVSWK